MKHAAFQNPSNRRPAKSFRLRFIALIVLGLALAASGCTPTGPAGAQAQIEPGTVLFSDDFSNPPSGWGTWSRGGATVEYHGGGLRILVSDDQFDFWSVAGQKFTDSSISVDAIKLDGPDDNDFGVVCRYQNKDNFYMLIISSDGYYGIAKMKDGHHSLISADQLQYSEAIARGQALNHLRADCIGPRLTLYANDQALVEIEDAEFTSGDVGVIAGAYDTGGVDILFDNFVVAAP